MGLKIIPYPFLLLICTIRVYSRYVTTFKVNNLQKTCKDPISLAAESRLYIDHLLPLFRTPEPKSCANLLLKAFKAGRNTAARTNARSQIAGTGSSTIPRFISTNGYQVSYAPWPPLEGRCPGAIAFHLDVCSPTRLTQASRPKSRGYHRPSLKNP